MNTSVRINKLLPPKTRSLLHALGALAAGNGYDIYLVGGIVRDLLLGRENLDIDIAVDGDGQAFALLVAESMNGSVVMHGRFGTSVVILPGKTRVDIATARTETYRRPGALPEVSFAPIRYDLERRDFSINAMAISLKPSDFGDLADYYGGQADLKNGIIRSLYPESFIDDPTRILRAVRFEIGLGFVLDIGTEDRLLRSVEGGYLGKVSGARLRKEIFGIAEGPSFAAALERLGSLGVWNALVPGLRPDAAAYRTLAELVHAETSLGRDLKPSYKHRFAVLTALLSDSASDAAEAFCGIIDISRFRKSLISDFSAQAAGLADRIGRATIPSELYADLANTSEESLAVLWASGGTKTREAVEKFMSIRSVKPFITGRDLVKLGYPPSKTYAIVLRDVFAAQLDGKVKNRSEAEAAAKGKLN